ncbi:hypothetical protein CFP56_005638, partial [Quercus suber]
MDSKTCFRGLKSFKHMHFHNSDIVELLPKVYASLFWEGRIEYIVYTNKMELKGDEVYHWPL